MTSNQIKKLLEEDKGKLKLYKLCEKHFNLVDLWESILVEGDILNEYELSQCQEQLTGVIMRLNPIAGALESYKEYILQNQLVIEQAKFEDKFRTQDGDIAKAKARKASEEFGDIVADFRHYFYAAQAGVVMCQSRMKRLTIAKGASGIDYCGETKVDGEE